MTGQSPIEYVFLSNIGNNSTEYADDILNTNRIPNAKSSFSANPAFFYKISS